MGTETLLTSPSHFVICGLDGPLPPPGPPPPEAEEEIECVYKDLVEFLRDMEEEYAQYLDGNK